MEVMNFSPRSVLTATLVSALLASAIGCNEGHNERAPEPKPPTPTAGANLAPAPTPAAVCAKPPITLADNESLLSIVATNDIHGTIDPKVSLDGKTTTGGLAFWAGAVKSIRDGVAKRYGNKGGVLVLDGGDQFQGSLLSNFSEGALMFSLLGDVGYDAMVPGNHDYDFGPEGWLVDQVPAGQTGDPRGVIKKLAGSALFPLLSSNAYVKSSLKTLEGKPATVDSKGCTSADVIDWSKAERPEFLKSYVIKPVAGVRVAIIGLDNPATPTITTPANVSDLCFRSSAEEYLDVRKALEGQADVFVLVIHDGDINNEKNLTNLVTQLQAARPDAVDAVIGGHTHAINNIDVNGVHAIQSGAYGEKFGRIDLVIDTATKKVIRDKTRVAAGAVLYQNACDTKIDSFCDQTLMAHISYECEPIVESAPALDKIVAGKKDIAPLVGRDLGFADAPITKSATNESALVNLMTDAYRHATGVELALINTGGVRQDIKAGPFTYEAWYAISPFNNRAVILGPMKVDTLVKIMGRSARTCGKSGAVLGSGIRVTYERGDCKTPDADGNDANSRVVTIAMDNHGADGELLYDARDVTKIYISSKTLTIATLDFLQAGGSGFIEFKDVPMIRDAGIFREVVADELAKSPGKLPSVIDGRFKNFSVVP
jgi:5'-nucleotidase